LLKGNNPARCRPHNSTCRKVYCDSFYRSIPPEADFRRGFCLCSVALAAFRFFVLRLRHGEIPPLFRGNILHLIYAPKKPLWIKGFFHEHESW